MKHTGGCHCGKVRYEVDADLSKAISCNCSMCKKRGSLLAFTPWENFKLLKGEADLQTYLFNKHVIQHQFCKTCGILSFAKGKHPKTGAEMAAINVRSIDNVDLDKVEIQHIDGKSF